jgi:hypothetical protein
MNEKESVDYCLQDYKHHHSWSKVGVERGMIIYQCSGLVPLPKIG